MSQYQKPKLISYFTLLVLYILSLLFFTFVLFKVNKTQDKAHKCAFISMIVCLQLASFCKFTFFLIVIFLIVLGYNKKKSISENIRNKAKSFTL